MQRVPCSHHFVVGARSAHCFFRAGSFRQPAGQLETVPQRRFGQSLEENVMVSVGIFEKRNEIFQKDFGIDLNPCRGQGIMPEVISKP